MASFAIGMDSFWGGMRRAAHGHWAADRDSPGVAAPESRPQMGGRFVDSLARGCLVWAFDTGCFHTRLAYGALRALDDAGVRVLRIVRLGFRMGGEPRTGDEPICASV